MTPQTKLSPTRFIALNALVAVIYFGAAELGLSLASVHMNVSPVWPPTGIAIATLLIAGPRFFPAILVGAFAANLFPNVLTSLPTSLTTKTPALAVLGIAIGNALEALCAYWLLNRQGKWRNSFATVSAVTRFIFMAAIIPPAVSATIGNLSLYFVSADSWQHLPELWVTWWLGDCFGAIILTPFLLAWAKPWNIEPIITKEVVACFALLFVTSMVIFDGWAPGPDRNYPIAYVCLPFLLWAGLKFNERVVTSAVLLLSAIAVWGAAHGYGPFIQADPNASLLLLLSFVGTSALMTLIVFAVISERESAEAEKLKLVGEVELHRRRIEDLVAHVPGVVWEAWGQPDEESQRIDFVSNHVEKMLGYSEEEWLSTPNFWLTIVHDDDRERAAKEAAAIYNSGRGGSSRFRWMHRDGREVWVEAQSIVVSDERGNPVGMRGVTMDITPAVRAEQERAELLSRESEARSEAEEANRLKDEFLATVSHELRTPLNAVVGWSRLLRTGQLDNDGTLHAVEVIERNAASQKQIIEDLLDVSRIITGKLRMTTVLVDLMIVVRSAVDVVRPAAEAKEISTEIKADPCEFVVRGDVDRLQQITWNLLANAVKFTPHGGMINVILNRVDSFAELRVVDPGPGIPVDFLPRIFDRFTQADSSSTRKHGGLGLGLAIVRHLVELHGGTVQASNREESGGAVVIVRLPIAEAKAARR